MRTGTPRELGFRWPAEWEPQRATWLAWPHNASDWPGKFAAIHWVFCEMIRCLSEVERVGLIVPSEPAADLARRTLRTASARVENVDLMVAETDRSWTRDFLPTWLVRDASATLAAAPSTPRLGAVKWLFNGWARYPDHERDEAAGRIVAQRRTPLTWTPRQRHDPSAPRFVLEGGAIDTDGQGTLLTTSDCLLGTAHPRNPNLDRGSMERVLGEYLAIDKVLWLPAGVAGDDTSGHVDDLARFVSPGRVVLAREKNPKDENYAPLERAREYLEGARDARGRRLDVIPLPMPAPRYYEGERLPASYANFLIANEIVLVPTFNDPSDRHVLGLLAELFPDRKVIGIHCLDLVLGLGSIHCSTHHEPLADG
jgi:agmatine deiminase